MSLLSWIWSRDPRPQKTNGQPPLQQQQQQHSPTTSATIAESTCPGETTAVQRYGSEPSRARSSLVDSRSYRHSRPWPAKSKATAVTQVSRESISAAELSSAHSSPLTLPVLGESVGKTSSSLSKEKTELTLGCSENKLSACESSVSHAKSPYVGPSSSLEHTSTPQTKTNAAMGTKDDKQAPPGDPGLQDEEGDSTTHLDDDTTLTETQQGGGQQSTDDESKSWLGWLMRSMPQGATKPKATQDIESQDMKEQQSQSTEYETPSTTGDTAKQHTDKQAQKDEDESGPSESSDNTPDDQSHAAPPRGQSFLERWKDTIFSVPWPMTQGKPTGDETGEDKSRQTSEYPPPPQETTKDPCQSPSDANSEAPSLPKAEDTTSSSTLQKRSSWLFWPRIMTSDQSTQGKEKPEARTAKSDGKTPEKKDDRGSRSPTGSRKGAPVSLPPGVSPDTISQEQAPTPEKPSKDEPAPIKHKKPIPYPNQVLPAVRSTLPTQERPRLLQQLGRLFTPSSHKEQPAKHVTLTTQPRRITKAVAIGVHGYFPAPILRRVLGPPTGTSLRFATMAAKAISAWSEEHGQPECKVTKVPLIGEGRIAERVEALWELLKNYIDEIREADLVLVACHSQGVPVSTMLVSKLIASGAISADRVGMCAMAGINLGPFADYKSRLIGGAAGELFEFTDPESRVSQEYGKALEHVLDAGCRIVYIGGIDDQLVPLESSVFSSVSHPYIYRAVFVDGRVHAPSFLSHLFGFIMKLRNLGISDHGLIRELSSPVAGSLYSGEGHSRVYDDDAVYRLAVDFILESLPVSNPKLERHRAHIPRNQNPYILPFIMRGVLEEEYVRKELAGETRELLKQFDSWRPATKVLKDVKFRLEGIRSKL